jgi:hypothetical protein
VLGTVSAVALAFAANGAVAEGNSPNIWASIEGQYAMFSGDAVDLNFYGESAKLSPDDGWAGALKLGGKVTENWFAEGGIRYGESGKDSLSYFYSPYAFADADYDEDHLMLDLQIGRDIGIGDGGYVRVFGGVRYANFDGNTNFYGYYYGSSLGLKLDHKFNGVGPRVGFDASIPVSGDVRVELGAAAAALYGKRKVKGTAFYSGYAYSASDSDKKFVPNLEGNIALTYEVGSYMSISAGYRAEQFWNVMPELQNSGIKYDDRLIHGPFLRLTFRN